MLKLRENRCDSQLGHRTVSRMRGGKPETDNIETNHWDESLDALLVEVQWDLEQASCMTGQKENHSNDELRK